MNYNKEEGPELGPEDREYNKKLAAMKRFYYIDVRPGDIIRLERGEAQYFGLVVETYSQIVQAAEKISGKIQWSIEKPDDQSWYELNSNNWFVMNR